MKNKEIPDVIIQGSMMYNPNDYKIVDKQYLNIRKDLVSQNVWRDIESAPDAEIKPFLVEWENEDCEFVCLQVFWVNGFLYASHSGKPLDPNKALSLEHIRSWQPLPTDRGML